MKKVLIGIVIIIVVIAVAGIFIYRYYSTPNQSLIIVLSPNSGTYQIGNPINIKWTDKYDSPSNYGRPSATYSIMLEPMWPGASTNLGYGLSGDSYNFDWQVKYQGKFVPINPNPGLYKLTVCREIYSDSPMPCGSSKYFTITSAK